MAGKDYSHKHTLTCRQPHVKHYANRRGDASWEPFGPQIRVCEGERLHQISLFLSLPLSIVKQDRGGYSVWDT